MTLACSPELKRIRARSYVSDEEQKELDVRCVAVALPVERVCAAVSISAPVGRVTDELLESAVPLLRAIAGSLLIRIEEASLRHREKPPGSRRRDRGSR